MALAQNYNTRRYAAPPGNRSRIGPRTSAASTTRPRCVISSSPRITSRRAARRTGSISSRQFSPSVATARATSLGQILAPAARRCRVDTISCSSRRPTGSLRADLHAAEQKRTDGQLLRQRFCHPKRRPQARQILCSTVTGSPTACGVDVTNSSAALAQAPKSAEQTLTKCEAPLLRASHHSFTLVHIISNLQRTPDGEKSRGPGK